MKIASAVSSRREFLSGGIGLLTFVVAGCEKKLTPAQAKAQSVPLRTLGEAEGRTIEALGEILLPGAAAAGLAQYIDHQLSGPVGDSMLMLKYLGVAPPFAPFYRGGIESIEAASQALHSKPLAALDAKEGEALVAAMAQGKIEKWSGPPAGLFYFTLRSDAVDVVYGTMKGFEQLGVPYMPHILPQSRWGE